MRGRREARNRARRWSAVSGLLGGLVVAAGALAIASTAMASADTPVSPAPPGIPTGDLPILSDPILAPDEVNFPQAPWAWDQELQTAYTNDLYDSPLWPAVQGGVSTSPADGFLDLQWSQEVTYAHDVAAIAGFDAAQIHDHPGTFSGVPAEHGLASALDQLHTADTTLLDAINDHASGWTVFGDELNVDFVDWFQVNPDISAVDTSELWTSLVNLF